MINPFCIRKLASIDPFFLIGIGLLVIALQGCSTGGTKTSSGLESSNLLKSFADGDVRLTCSVGCSGAWGTTRRHAKSLYEAELWNDLAREVMRVGYSEDLTYYYLARAAEETGHEKAALTYYRLALTTHKCDGTFNTCDGIPVNQIVRSKIDQLRAKNISNIQAQPAVEKSIASSIPNTPKKDSPQMLDQHFPEKSPTSSTVGISKSPDQSSRHWLEATLKSAIKGTPLKSYWCQKYSLLSAELFAPRSYEILNEEPYGESLQTFVIRIESSNRGGISIIKDWFFLVDYEKEKSTWCLAQLMAKN